MNRVLVCLFFVSFVWNCTALDQSGGERKADPTAGASSADDFEVVRVSTRNPFDATELRELPWILRNNAGGTLEQTRTLAVTEVDVELKNSAGETRTEQRLLSCYHPLQPEDARSPFDIFLEGRFDGGSQEARRLRFRGADFPIFVNESNLLDSVPVKLPTPQINDQVSVLLIKTGQELAGPVLGVTVDKSISLMRISEQWTTVPGDSCSFVARHSEMQQFYYNQIDEVEIIGVFSGPIRGDVPYELYIMHDVPSAIPQPYEPQQWLEDLGL